MSLSFCPHNLDGRSLTNLDEVRLNRAVRLRLLRRDEGCWCVLLRRDERGGKKFFQKNKKFFKNPLTNAVKYDIIGIPR
jgi:hypothetical protein